MTRVPSLVELVLLGLGAFRLVRLVAYDEITTDLRTWATRISDADYKQTAAWVESQRAAGADPWNIQTPEGRAMIRVLPERRYYLAKLLRCPWCVGWWLSLLVWAAWSVEPRVTLWLAVPFAISAIVGLIAKNLDP